MTDLAPIRWTVDTITAEALDALYASLEEARTDLARYEEVQGEMNERAIDLTRDVARTQAALSDMTRDRNQQKWYVAENDRKRKVQRARAEQAEAAVARVEALLARGPIGTCCDHLVRAALNRATPVPAATEATQSVTTEAMRQMDTDTTQPHTGLVVQPYRDHGKELWVFRCWGTDTCDGWLSLDHYSRQSAERARDRHVDEDHKEQH